jgi:hypothetical protein
MAPGIASPVNSMSAKRTSSRPRVTSRPSTGAAGSSPCSAKPDTSGSRPARDMAMVLMISPRIASWRSRAPPVRFRRRSRQNAAQVSDRSWPPMSAVAAAVRGSRASFRRFSGLRAYGRGTDRGGCGRVTPVIQRGIRRMDAERLRGVDRLEHLLDLARAGEMQQALAARMDMCNGGESLAGPAARMMSMPERMVP